MSRDNIETVRRSIEAWNRRDLQELTALYSSDAEIDWSRSRGPFRGVYRGQRELEGFWDVFWSTFEEVQLEPHGFTEADSGIVVSNTAHFRGRDGIELTAKSALVFTLEDRQITCLRLFQDRAEALEATGLNE